jgi:hypothetical protein
MCIKPIPVIYSCPSYHWSKKVTPMSDVLSQRMTFIWYVKNVAVKNQKPPAKLEV